MMIKAEEEEKEKEEVEEVEKEEGPTATGRRRLPSWIDDELLGLIIARRQLPRFVSSSAYYPPLVDHLRSLFQSSSSLEKKKKMKMKERSEEEEKEEEDGGVGAWLVAFAVASLCEESLHLFAGGLVCRCLSLLHPSLFTVNNSLAVLHAFLLAQTRTQDEEDEDEVEEDDERKKQQQQCRDMCARALEVLLHDCPHLSTTG